MQLWDSILSSIEKKVSPQNFDLWFQPTTPFQENLEKGELLVRVPNQHFKYWLSENYREVIDASLEELDLSSFKVSFLAADEAVEEESHMPLVSERKLPGRFLNPVSTFESFVVGDCNQLAHAAAQAVARSPARAYNPLFIYGGVGLGKTHLMHAIGHYIRDTFPELQLTYMSAEQFTNEMIQAIRVDETAAFRRRYRDVDVLLMDDIQFLANKERTQEEFFHTFNTLYQAQKQIIISSDSPPAEIPTLEEGLHSRFEWGLIADLQMPDLETKVAILRKKAELHQVELPPEVALFIAESIRSNVRALEGALNRLFAHRKLTGESISLSAARRILKDIARRRARTLTPPAIQKVVADQFGIDPPSLCSRNNARSVSEPRQIAMYLCKELTSQSLSEIGASFGGKHHTTVLHSVRKIDQRRREDIRFRSLLESLKSKLE